MTQRPSLSDTRILLATWFGAGYAPVAPGTMGSLFALPIGWALAHEGGWAALLGATIVVTLGGVWAANAYMAAAGEHDPGPVVIDEVAGQWLTLLPAAAFGSVTWQVLVVGFVLFRVFDIWKPWPISWVDAHIKGGFGVMADDILAGLAAAACLWGLVLGAPRLLGLL